MLTKVKMSKVIVVGAGAAGMIAAITAAEAGHQVIVIEKNEKPGKKLFITGKGRCNVTNDCDVETLLNNVTVNKKFLYSAFYGFTSQDMMKLLEDAGLKLKVERGNRVFPQSDKSSDVIKTLRLLMEKNHVEVMYQQTVKELIFDRNTPEKCKIKGVRLEDGRCLTADSVIVATGGLSYPVTGATGDGYLWAKSAGHDIKPTYPSLVPLNIKEEWVKEMQGLSLKNVRLSVFKGKKKIFEDFGEMLFTHFGISGPLVLSASPVCIGHMKDEKKKKDGRTADKQENIESLAGKMLDAGLEAEIDLKPALDEMQLDSRLVKDFEKYNNKQFHNALADLLPSKMIPVIVALSGIDAYKKVHMITREERQSLCRLLKHLRMHISGVRGYHEAIITKGGVSVKDINPSTMESKLCGGLYFAGEVLDLDAVTGGFNLQIAWSTGRLAGGSIH